MNKATLIRRGFTLIELLVVIGIIILLTALILPNYHANQREHALQLSAQRIALDLRSAQDMALSTLEFHGEVPLGGYGVYFHAGYGDDSYILFADCDGDKSYDPSGSLCNGFSEKIREVHLEGGVEIRCLFDCIGPNYGYIVFTPPDPQITINSPDLPEPTSLKITLCLEGDVDKIKTIEINKAGKTDIE